MKVFTGARIFDGERLHDDCALVVEGASIAALTRFEDRPRGGERSISAGEFSPRLYRLADQRRRRRSVQRRADGGRDRRDRRRASARGRHRLPADCDDRRAAGARRGAGGRARGAEIAFPARSGSMSKGRSSIPAQGRASGRVHPPDAGRGRRRADRRARGAMVVTLAPASVPLERIARLTRAGLIVSLGHSDASAEEAQASSTRARAPSPIFTMR